MTHCVSAFPTTLAFVGPPTRPWYVANSWRQRSNFSTAAPQRRALRLLVSCPTAAVSRFDQQSWSAVQIAAWRTPNLAAR